MLCPLVKDKGFEFVTLTNPHPPPQMSFFEHNKYSIKGAVLPQKQYHAIAGTFHKRVPPSLKLRKGTETISYSIFYGKNQIYHRFSNNTLVVYYFP